MIRPGPTIDVYSLGAILARLVRDDGAIDQTIMDVCDKAMSVDPSNRYQSAQEFGEAFSSVGNVGVAPD